MNVVFSDENKLIVVGRDGGNSVSFKIGQYSITGEMGANLENISLEVKPENDYSRKLQEIVYEIVKPDEPVVKPIRKQESTFWTFVGVIGGILLIGLVLLLIKNNQAGNTKKDLSEEKDDTANYSLVNTSIPVHPEELKKIK